MYAKASSADANGTRLAAFPGMASADLLALEARLRREIEMTAPPRTEWMVPRLYRGKPALDGLIVGAGQSGVCIAVALMRGALRSILPVDRAPECRAGIGAAAPR